MAYPPKTVRTNDDASDENQIALVFDNSQGRLGGPWAQYNEIAVRRLVGWELAAPGGLRVGYQTPGAGGWLCPAKAGAGLTGLDKPDAQGRRP